MIIGHPMGAVLAEELEANDPGTIPHALSGKNHPAGLILDLPLQVQAFRDENDLHFCVSAAD